jgi:hypothetical protein
VIIGSLEIISYFEKVNPSTPTSVGSDKLDKRRLDNRANFSIIDNLSEPTLTPTADRERVDKDMELKDTMSGFVKEEQYTVIRIVFITTCFLNRISENKHPIHY